MDDTLINKALPEAIQKKNTLLKGLFSGELSIRDFDKESAYWLISCDNLTPLPLPTRPPELLEYDTWSPQEKKNTSEKFWRQERVFAYMNQKQSVLDRNKGMLDKLIEFKTYIPDGDIPTLAKYDRFIALYREFFNPSPLYPENWQDKQNEQP